MWQPTRESKTARLERLLMEEIASRGLHAHDRFLTEAEIVEKFGINLTTVRQTLVRLVSNGIIYRISGKGTFVSPPTRNTTVLVVSESNRRPNPFTRMGFFAFLESLAFSAESEEFGCYPLSISFDEYNAHAREIPRIYRNLGGVIFFSDPKPYERSQAILSDHGVPAIYYGADMNLGDRHELNALTYPQREVVQLALDHLFEKGYRRIGLVAAAPRSHRQQRVQLFEEWMQAHLPGWNAAQMVSVNADGFAPATEGPLEDRIRKAVQEHGIEAWFSIDDAVAYRFVNAAYLAGFSFPQDMALVSVSNLAVCEQAICPFSSVEIPFGQDALRCLQLLSDMRAGRYRTIREQTRVRLVARRSSDGTAGESAQG